MLCALKAHRLRVVRELGPRWGTIDALQQADKVATMWVTTRWQITYLLGGAWSRVQPECRCSEEISVNIITVPRRLDEPARSPVKVRLPSEFRF